MFLSVSTILLGLLFPFMAAAQDPSSAQQTPSAIFKMAVNGKPMLFNQGKILAFTVKEDGSVSISAQTTTDILNTNILVLNITPADTSKRITKGEYKILPEDVVSDFMVRAEYSANENGNSSYWWSDASKVKGGSVFIDEITGSGIKGRFSFTGVLEKEDGSMGTKKMVKITNGVFDLPLEIKSRFDAR
jgi:hypothetical protein